jgi:hypothetical protein
MSVLASAPLGLLLIPIGFDRTPADGFFRKSK